MKAGFGSASGAVGGNPKFVPPPAADLAKLFPQLELLDLIGQGGMGAVYRARQPGLDRLVAIKILPPESTTDPGFAERFAREARALAKLNHPNIVGVYDFGQTGGLHYFLMEYVDGLNLRQLAQSGRVTPREALQIIPQMCDALQFAHEEGIVHRDIKPENVMVDKKGRVKITDFGLAKLLGREPENMQLTGARDVMGTPHYMAPEQMEKPNEVDHRADIFSLGVVFYELLTGELPIGKFAPPSKKVAVDVRLDEVVLHTLEREPARRYQHASEVKSDVETIAQTPASRMPPPVAERTVEQAWAEDARSQVRGPGIGLLVTAVVNWATVPLATIIVNSASSRPLSIFVPLLAMLLSGLIFVAGLKMKRLQSYWLAVTGSVMAILVTPGNLIGLPIGIWSLVVLTQRRVREAFGKEFPPPSPVLAVPRSGGAWKVVAVIVAAMIFLLSIPVGAILLSILIPALHRAKPKARTAQVELFSPEKMVTLYEVTERMGSEGLDLDKGLVLDVPPEVSLERLADVRRWFADEGVDLLLVAENNEYGFVIAETNGVKLTFVPGSAWNGTANPDPAAILADFARIERRKGLVAHFLSEDARLPITLTFETAAGTSGLMQLTGFSNETPAHAVVRFKVANRPNL
jgi:predicted Ser/Thr protein kinase